MDIDPSGALLEVSHHTHPKHATLAVGRQFRLEHAGDPSINSTYAALYSHRADDISVRTEDGLYNLKSGPIFHPF